MTVEWQSALQSVIHHPLFGIGITLGAYQLVLAGYEKTRWIFLQPVLASMLLVIGVLVARSLRRALQAAEEPADRVIASGTGEPDRPAETAAGNGSAAPRAR